MITVLKVAKTAGQVAEVGLAITGVTGIVRGTVSVAGGAAAGDAAVDAAAERMIAKHYAKDVEIMADLNKVKVVPRTEGQRGRRRQARHKLRRGNRLAQVVIQWARQESLTHRPGYTYSARGLRLRARPRGPCRHPAGPVRFHACWAVTEQAALGSRRRGSLFRCRAVENRSLDYVSAPHVKLALMMENGHMRRRHLSADYLQRRAVVRLG